MELSGLRGEGETRHEACTGRERRRRREGTDWVIVEVGGQALARAGLTDGWRGEGVEGTGSLGFWDANCYIWNRWAMGPYCTAQGTVCDWVTVLYHRI